MKQDGAYSLLEPEELGEPLAELDAEFGNFEFRDSRVSTYSSVDTAYNGALLIVADEKPGRFEKEELVEELVGRYGRMEDDSLFLRKEGSGPEGFYYSVADTRGRDSLDAS